MIAVANAPQVRRRRTRGLPAADHPIAIAATPTSDPTRLRGLLAFGLDLVARAEARQRQAVDR